MQASAMEAEPVPVDDGGAAQAGRRHVLVVDDSEVNRIILRDLLERFGYVVTLAADGAAALRELSRARPSLVLLDFLMPKMDGPEVARLIRARRDLAQIPIILVTASAAEQHIDAAFEAGAADYLTKPVDPRILKQRVAATIRAAEDRARAQRGERLRRELQEASLVQQARLPALPGAFGAWRVSGAVVPCNLVGGDAIDVMAGYEGARVLALIDVAGHGAAAALVACSVGDDLRSLVSSHPLPEAISILNHHLARGGAGRYACVAAVQLREGEARIVNAGLPPVCVLRRGRAVLEVEASGTPPGLIDDMAYSTQSCPLRDGDRIVAMSDGLTEPFGDIGRIGPALDGLGLRDPSVGAGRLAPSLLSARIGSLLRERGAEPADDAAVLVADLGARAA